MTLSLSARSRLKLEELEAKLKGLGDRFCKVTLPAILQLAKQQGESVDLDKASVLGMKYMHDIYMKL